MNVDGIEVSSFCSECALFEYVIKREYVFTDKRLILACAVTYCEPFFVNQHFVYLFLYL